MIDVRNERVPSQYGYIRRARLYIADRHIPWDMAFAIPAMIGAVVIVAWSFA